MRLLLRPKPDKGESFIGYLVRLTELNGYDTPSWILSLSGIDYMELQWTFAFIFSKSKGLEKLAHLTNKHFRRFQHACLFSGEFFSGVYHRTRIQFLPGPSKSLDNPSALPQNLPRVFVTVRLLSPSLG